jgi:carbonic anhydrase
MKRILKFHSRRKHYIADACVVWCIDDRFTHLLQRFQKQQGLKRIDLVRLAGGGKAAASPNGDSEELVLLRQIDASVRLHHAPLVVVMNHEDCGGYGGSATFGNNPAKERQFHERELKRAARTIKRRFPDLKVRAVYADFEGLSEVR